jgi:PAS domain S-box-containing protein
MDGDTSQETSGTAPEGPKPLELALDYIEDYAVFLLDVEGRIASWNVGAERLKGYAPAEAIGQPFAMLFTREERACGKPEEEMAHAAAHGVYQGEGRRVRKDGTEFDAEVTLRSIRDGDGGALRGFVKVTRDITARRTAENAARVRAQFEEELMGIVSHDLRSPLATILMSVERLKKLQPTEAQARALARTEAAAQRAARLVNELLDFTQARLGGGLPVRRREDVDLHALAAQAAADAAADHPGRVLVVRHAGTGEGAWDADRLIQALGNLLSNALAYGDPARPVTLSTREQGAWVEVEVHSWGEPIPEGLLPVLFDRLTRGAQKEAGQRGSVGLGLFIVHHIARAHGGHVAVKSTREEGTAFRLCLPRRGPVGAVH